jgi:hypothetical protein
MSRRRVADLPIFRPSIMPLKSKAARSHIQNLSMSSKQSQKVYMEDVEDEDAPVLPCHLHNCHSERSISNLGLQEPVVDPDLVKIFMRFEELGEKGCQI